MRIIGVVVALSMLAGCQILQPQETLPPDVKTAEKTKEIKRSFCFYDKQPPGFKHNCEAKYWVNLWIEASNQSWSVRKAQIKALESTPYDVVKGYILSLPNDTPYQDRLRAQLLLDGISDTFTPTAQEVVNVVAGKQNRQLMELESALVILEKENTARGEQIKQLENDATNLRKKLAELLQIEATLMDKSRSTQQ